MKDKEIITHKGHQYEYSEFYKRLEINNTTILSSNLIIVPHILCPICLSDIFKLQYGVYEINAICNCGHSMTVYDG